MFVLIMAALFGSSVSVFLDPTLTDWRLLTTNEERVLFPLREYVLEVKAFLPDVYDTNPPYGELFRTDKSTTMMMLLHVGNWNVDKKVARLVWNTIKYDRGYDIAIEECDARYKAYRSFPAGGEKEQIWAWSFFQDRVELTCNGEMQYVRGFDEGEFSLHKLGLPEKCRALGDADVDRITFKHMKGFYIRGRFKEERKPPVMSFTTANSATTSSPTSVSSSTPEDIDDLDLGKDYPTCDCWTRECSFCSNLECTVKHDLATSKHGIIVSSMVKRKQFNSIVLYDDDGNVLGSFQWSLNRIFLTGCISCLAPRAVRQAAKSSDGQITWALTLKGGVVRIKIEGEVVYRYELKGPCAHKFSKVKRFAFSDMTCESSFKLLDEMEPGASVTPDCAGSCPTE